MTAGQHVAVHLHSAQATVEGGVVIDVSALDLDVPQAWCDHYGVTVTDGRAELYKAVDESLAAGHNYTKTTYSLDSELTCADWRDDNNCGGGLHLSPTPHMASAYFSTATRFLRCSVALDDLRPINNGDTPKAKARAVRVESEVDAFARELVSA